MQHSFSSKWLLFVLAFLIQACSKDDLAKYEGEYSFTTKVADYNQYPVLYDTILSTGTVKEISSSVLEVNIAEHIMGDTVVGLFLPGPVQIKVDKDGKISIANEKFGDFLKVSGQFEGTEKLTMKEEMCSPYYGAISTVWVEGIRIHQ